MRDIDREPALSLERAHGGHDGRVVSVEVPSLAALPAGEVTMLRLWQDVEFFAPVCPMAVAEDTKILQHVQGAIHGGRDRAWIQLAAAFHELGARDVTIGARQDLDEDPALWRPAQTTCPQTIGDSGPGRGRTAAGSQRGS